MAASGGTEDCNISDYDSDTEPLIGATSDTHPQIGTTSGTTSLQKTLSSTSTIDLFGSDSDGDTPPQEVGKQNHGGSKKSHLTKRDSSVHEISESDTDSDRTIDPNEVLFLNLGLGMMGAGGSHS